MMHPHPRRFRQRMGRNSSEIQPERDALPPVLGAPLASRALHTL